MKREDYAIALNQVRTADELKKLVKRVEGFDIAAPNDKGFDPVAVGKLRAIQVRAPGFEFKVNEDAEKAVKVAKMKRQVAIDKWAEEYDAARIAEASEESASMADG